MANVPTKETDDPPVAPCDAAEFFGYVDTTPAPQGCNTEVFVVDPAQEEEWKSLLADLSSARTALMTRSYQLAISKEKFEAALNSAPNEEIRQEAIKQFEELKSFTESVVSNAMECVRRNHEQALAGVELAVRVLRNTTLSSALTAIKKATQLGVQLNGEPAKELERVERSLSSL